MSVEEQIKDIEEELARTKHNKATEHHIGTLRGKLAKLKEEQIKRSSKSKGEGYGVKKEGDRTAVIVGFPSVGKSTLLNKLTNAESKVAAYEFTTITAIPGMMEYNNTRIQLVDLPGIIEEASQGRGGGKQIMSVARNADLILIVLDATKPQHLAVIKKELYDAGLRLDVEKPNVMIKKLSKGGINISFTKTLTKTSEETIKALLREFRLSNAEVIVRSDISESEMIDAILANRHYVSSLVVVNKVDIAKPRIPNAMFISAEKGKGLNLLKQKIWEKLDVVRIYPREPGKEIIKSKPLIARNGITAGDVAKKIRIKEFRYAKIWGSSAKFQGQKIGEQHKLCDKDIITFY
ncbi:GTP-binding protein [archaeon CG10_big_fil_rev_8_21_14_0_10_43_11]|nr:MAG: GTP-binding protein [archaeon CG10_big_fil_rev_8_21_14_0_10_43_11]